MSFVLVALARMRTLTLDAKFSVVENNLSPNEHRPRIDFYWSGHFLRERVSVPIASASASAGQEHNVRVTGQIPAVNCPIPENAALCMHSFAERVNEFGVPCVTDAGTAFISLGELMQHNFYRDGPFVRKCEMLMRTDNNFVKSCIEFRVENEKQISFTGTNNATVALELAPCPINASSVGTELLEYVQSVMRMSHELKDAYQGTGNMRVPFNMSEVGRMAVHSDQLALPAISYTMIDIPKSNAHFWINSAECVLKRRGQTVEQVLKMPIAKQAIVAMRLVVFGVQCKPYIGDTIDKNKSGSNIRNLVIPYENFGEAWIGSDTAASAGDCEDLAKAIMAVYLALLSQSFVLMKDAMGQWLRTAQFLLRQYMPFMVLACVHGQQLSDSDKNKVGGAHMTILMFPLHYAKACLERSSEGKKLSDATIWPPREQMGHGLPCSILEGTGMLEPEKGGDAKAQWRAQVYSKMSSISGLKKWLFQPTDSAGHATESRFFMAALEGYTPTFRQTMGRPEYGGFWLLNKNGERGARFVDFMDQTDNFILKPQPKVPESVLQLMIEGMQLLVPSDPLYLTPGSKKLSSPILDELVDRAASLGRTERVKQYVSAWLSPHQLTEQLGEEIWRDVRKNDFIAGVSYDVEPVTDNQTSYRLKFHL